MDDKFWPMIRLIRCRLHIHRDAALKGRARLAGTAGSALLPAHHSDVPASRQTQPPRRSLPLSPARRSHTAPIALESARSLDVTRLAREQS